MPNPILVVIQPLILLIASLLFLPVTIIKLLVTGDFTTLTNLSKFKDAWFGSMWNVFALRLRAVHEPRVAPLLQGRVRAGRKYDGQPHKPVHGTVLEIGPGTGNWVSCFSSKYLGPPNYGTNGTNGNGSAYPDLKIQPVAKVYGVEPNPDLHAGLVRSIKAAGLSDTYQVVPTGIEDLAQAGIPKGSIDSIATILCLCSIPEPEKNIRELYEYLKPGGRWYVYEHVKTHKAAAVGLYQRILNVVWPKMMGGCDLCRDTQATLLAAGPWAGTDLAQPADEPWYAPVPHVIGVLTK